MVAPVIETRKLTLRERARTVLNLEASAISSMATRLDDSFDDAVEQIANCRGHVVTLGMGKSGIIAQKVASTLASTGTPSFFLHPAEALHGDFGRVTPGDIVLAFSYSGETEELLRLLPLIERSEDIALISIVGKTRSTLARASQIVLDAGVNGEACPLGLAPTASTTAAMALGDALAMALLEYRGFQASDFAALHPAGQLGRRLLLRVFDLMHGGEQVPRVTFETPMSEAIIEMSRKGFGITTVVDGDGCLLGVISDGDLRRLVERQHANALTVMAGDAMHVHHPRNPQPRTVTRSELATHALHLMESYRITSLVVVDEANRVEGLIHLHDLWKVFGNQ